MLQGIDLGFISTVLEPSAGRGFDSVLAEESIAQEHRYNPHTLNVDAIEIDPYIRSILKLMNLAVPDGKKFSIPCADLKIVPVTITNSTKRLV